jgi:putative hydrolase of the HAD superfamily
VTLRAVLFDVDFTLVQPGPDLGPDGYAALGRRFGLELDPRRHAEARAAAVEAVERHPELDHDEEVWVLFTERIIRGMGGESERAYEAAVEMARAWENAANFELYEDTLPVLQALRGHELKIGLVSNTGRDLEAFVSHHALDVDATVWSGLHGKTKPHPAIFLAALDALDVAAEEAAMVGDSPEDDISGARALGMRAFLVDREGRFPEAVDRLADLLALPAALGLPADALPAHE